MSSCAIAALTKAERVVLAAMAVLYAMLFSQPVFLLVAAGAGYRAFDRNMPAEPGHSVAVYYLALLAALGLLAELAPLTIPGR